MEEKLLLALEDARKKAADSGVGIRPIADMASAKRCLAGHRVSDGFYTLADKGLLHLSLEALAVKKQFTALFTDEEANNALTRLMDAGYSFM